MIEVGRKRRWRAYVEEAMTLEEVTKFIKLMANDLTKVKRKGKLVPFHLSGLPQELKISL